MKAIRTSFPPAARTEITPRPASLHIPSLDGIRAISFLLVFAAHAGWTLVPGGFGVTVFFFLSGYLITTLMRVESERTRRVDLRAFYRRRALRILPPFYVVLVAATALAQLGVVRGAGAPRTIAVALQAAHVSNYWQAAHGCDGVAPGTGVYWSLAVEEHFYLLFPLTFIGLLRLRWTGRAKAIACWAVCAAVLGWRFVLAAWLHAPAARTYLCSDTRIDSIAFGCALALWHNPALDAGGRPASADLGWARVVCPIALAVLGASFVVRAPLFRETLRYTVQGLALTPLFFAAIRWPRSGPFRALQWAPVRFLGTLSYSLYLVHQVVLFFVAEHAPANAVPVALLALALSVAVSWTIYVVVERPCARLRRAAKRITAPATATAPDLTPAAR